MILSDERLYDLSYEMGSSTRANTVIFNYIKAIYQKIIQTKYIKHDCEFIEGSFSDGYLTIMLVSYEKDAFLEAMEKYSKTGNTEAILIDNYCFFSNSKFIINVDKETNQKTLLNNAIEMYKVYGTSCKEIKGGGFCDIAEGESDLTAEEKKILLHLKSTFLQSIKKCEHEEERSRKQLELVKELEERLQEDYNQNKLVLSRKKKLMDTNSKSLVLEIISEFNKLKQTNIISNIEFRESEMVATITDMVIQIDYENDSRAISNCEDYPAYYHITNEYNESLDDIQAYYYVGSIDIVMGYASKNVTAEFKKVGQDYLPDQQGSRDNTNSYHPHISDGGDICLGNKGQIRLGKMLEQMKLADAFKFVALSLRTYVSSNPYDSIVEKYFKPYLNYEECLENGKSKTNGVRV